MVWLITGMTLGSLFFFVILIIGIYFIYKEHSIKRLTKKLGQKSEVLINNDINIWAKHTKNKFLKASLYKYDQNKVFETDGILVTKKALIVIEIKSIKGEVIGDAKIPQWTKKLGEVEHPIKNPVIQNDKHIDHIMKMMQLKVPIVSLIIFSNRTESIKVSNQPQHVIITRHSELYSKLDEIDSVLEPRLSDSQVVSLAKSIKNFKTTKSQDIHLHKVVTKQIKTT
ncbi:MAG: NERD domain-containing protein [Mycoplasma sp.]|nr:NERD domain-containing protein [Mycoplasma sp.]